MPSFRPFKTLVIGLLSVGVLVSGCHKSRISVDDARLGIGNALIKADGRLAQAGIAQASEIVSATETADGVEVITRQVFEFDDKPGTSPRETLVLRHLVSGTKVHPKVTTTLGDGYWREQLTAMSNGKEPFVAKIDGGLLGIGVSSVDVTGNPLSYSDADGGTIVTKSWTLHSEPGGKRLKARFTHDGLSLESDKGSVMLGPMNGDADLVAGLAPGIYNGTTQFRIKGLDLESRGRRQHVDRLGLSATQTESAPGVVEVDGRFTAVGISDPDSKTKTELDRVLAEGVTVDYGLHGFPSAALGRMAGERDQSKAMQALGTVLAGLKVPADARIGVQFKGLRDNHFTLGATLPPVSADPANAAAVLRTAIGSVTASLTGRIHRADAELLGGTGGTGRLLASGLFVLQGDQLQMNVRYAKGMVTLTSGQQLPIAAILAGMLIRPQT